MHDDTESAGNRAWREISNRGLLAAANALDRFGVAGGRQRRTERAPQVDQLPSG